MSSVPVFEHERSPDLHCKVLIVEDETISRNILSHLLTDQGMVVEAAPSGRVALQILEQQRDFDIILSDWSMPEMDGIELLSWVRNQSDLRSIYFIMITAKDEVDDKINALNAGADDFLTKPCHHEELIARVRSALRIRSLQNELLALEKRMTVLHLATAAGHEINNPLTGVFGYLDLIRDGIESEVDKETLISYLDKVAVQTERIRNIVTNLMTLKEVQVKPYIGNQDMIDLRLESEKKSHPEPSKSSDIESPQKKCL